MCYIHVQKYMYIYMIIIFMQDEECVRPGEPTDDTFLAKMSNNIGSHAHFISHQSAADTATRKSIARTVC